MDLQWACRPAKMKEMSWMGLVIAGRGKTQVGVPMAAAAERA